MGNSTPGAAHSSSPSGFNNNGIPPAIWQEFIARSEVVQFKQNEIAHKEDCAPKRAYFIHQGLMMCYLKKGERNIVNWISNEFAFGLDIITPSPVDGYVLMALEDTLAIAISHDDLMDLHEKYPQIKNVILSYLAKYNVANCFIQTNKFLSPKERYDSIQERVSFKLDRVPDIYLAAYLDITLAELKETQKGGV